MCRLVLGGCGQFLPPPEASCLPDGALPTARKARRHPLKASAHQKRPRIFLAAQITYIWTVRVLLAEKMLSGLR